MSYSRILKAQHAISMVAHQISSTWFGMAGIQGAEHGRDELRQVIDRIADALEEIVDKTAGPVWGELTDETRAVCRKAGMANCDEEAERAIACVNACKTLPTEFLKTCCADGFDGVSLVQASAYVKRRKLDLSPGATYE